MQKWRFVYLDYDDHPRRRVYDRYRLEFKLAVNGPYATAKLYALEADFSPLHIGRLK